MKKGNKMSKRYTFKDRCFGVLVNLAIIIISTCAMFYSGKFLYQSWLYLQDSREIEMLEQRGRDEGYTYELNDEILDLKNERVKKAKKNETYNWHYEHSMMKGGHESKIRACIFNAAVFVWTFVATITCIRVLARFTKNQLKKRKRRWKGDNIIDIKARLPKQCS